MYPYNDTRCCRKERGNNRGLPNNDTRCCRKGRGNNRGLRNSDTRCCRKGRGILQPRGRGLCDPGC